MPPLRRLTPFVVACLLAATSARAQEFVPGTEDLPLMKDLATVAGTDVVFDKPEGRIVEATARGKVSKSAVRSFYGETLPQLGWEAAASPDSWTRNTETLHLDFQGHDGDLWVTFSLVPR
jgi:hypothetical protein